MSWVEDARKLMQDFVAPELRAISARLDTSDKLAVERHAMVLEKLEGFRRELVLMVELAMVTRKLEELEEKQQGSSTQQ